MLRKLKAKGYSKVDIDRMVMVKEMMDSRKNLKEGQRVKLKVDQLRADPDWPDKQDTYKQWVEAHADETFTVKYDEKHSPVLVCLKECDAAVKWLFWEGDLEVVNEDIGTPANEQT